MAGHLANILFFLSLSLCQHGSGLAALAARLARRLADADDNLVF